MENDKHITLDREYFERAVKRAKHCGSHDTKYNAVGEALNGYTTVKQIKVMEVKG